MNSAINSRKTACSGFMQAGILLHPSLPVYLEVSLHLGQGFCVDILDFTLWQYSEVCEHGKYHPMMKALFTSLCSTSGMLLLLHNHLKSSSIDSFQIRQIYLMLDVKFSLYTNRWSSKLYGAEGVSQICMFSHYRFRNFPHRLHSLCYCR